MDIGREKYVERTSFFEKTSLDTGKYAMAFSAAFSQIDPGKPGWKRRHDPYYDL